MDMFWRQRILFVVVLFSILSLAFVVPASHENVSASEPLSCPLPLELPELATAQVVTIDHSFPHISSKPAHSGQPVCRFVRERFRAVGIARDPRKSVLLCLGHSV